MIILLVENHEDTATYLRLYLEGLGHNVSLASTLAEARSQLASRADFDLLLCDICLPDGRGWDLLADHDSLTIPAIAMSGFGTDADRERSLLAGFSHHLTKPFLPEEFDRILAGITPKSTHPDLAGATD